MSEAQCTEAHSAQCRFCAADLENVLIDLGMSPLCESFVSLDKLNHMERFYPLMVWICNQCWLAQLEEYVAPSEIFDDYAYFSSYSDSWVEHASKYAERIQKRLELSSDSLVIEVASNDVYLLQHFVKKNIPVLGIEPAGNVAQVALDKGIRTEVCFHGLESAARISKEYGLADLIVGNNVLAHVPDLHDFVGGFL